METESVLHQQQQQLPSAYRTLQPQAAQALQHAQPHLAHHTLPSQSTLDLSGLDDSDAVFHQEIQRQLHDPSNGQAFHPPNAFNRSNGSTHMHPQAAASPHTPQQRNNAGQFGILTPGQAQHNSISRLQQENELFGAPDGPDQKSNGHISTKIVVDPPNLAEWREKLFHVDEMITLSEEEFETYFAHIDNVYSHRSTQKYKRKPFVSHYWDCRLKGRPPGTPKSDDPNKKKRKRTARERDLCDVKIKITEYFPGAMLRADFVPDGEQGPVDASVANNFFSPSHSGNQSGHQQPFGVMATAIPSSHPGTAGQRYYTIQRVNGNGGNGKGDGVAGPHKHTLEESDRVKKNSVQRFLAKRDKEEKKTQVCGNDYLCINIVMCNEIILRHSSFGYVVHHSGHPCKLANYTRAEVAFGISNHETPLERPYHSIFVNTTSWLLIMDIICHGLLSFLCGLTPSSCLFQHLFTTSQLLLGLSPPSPQCLITEITRKRTTRKPVAQL